MSGLYLAHELGFFSDLALDVEIRDIPNNSSSLVLLAGGKLDAGFLALTPGLINSIAQKANLKLVAGREIASKSCGTVGTIYGNVRSFPDGLEDLTALRSKRVSIRFKASLSEFYLDALLSKAGLSSKDVDLVLLKEPEAAAALTAGKIDALVSSFFETSLEAHSPDIVKGIGLADVLPDFQYSFVFFGPTLIEGDREKGIRFLVGYLRGAEAFLQGKTPRYLYDLARRGRMDPVRTAEACRQTFVGTGGIDQKSVQMFIDWTAEKGYCSENVDAEQLIDSSYIQEAQKRFRKLTAGSAL